MLNRLPDAFPFKLSEEIVYLLATSSPSLEGSQWEQIFAHCIGAEWKPSNVGLDDIVLKQTAWGAKSIKNNRPHSAKTVPLISGRNSLDYSFGERDLTARSELLGSKVIEIWNERVSAIRAKYMHVRTVVLIKSPDLLDLTVFEFDMERYDPSDYDWRWNENENLEGHLKVSSTPKTHKFTWQPHGSQFTIVEDVPEQCLRISIRQPERLDKAQVLTSLGFSKDWVTIISR